MDSTKETAIIVHLPNNETWKFKENKDELYFLNNKETKRNNNKTTVNNYSYLNTGSENIETTSQLTKK